MSGVEGKRTDLDVIVRLISPKARVLDVGCGDGELLHRLGEKKEVSGCGVEISQRGVNACVARGLSVVQGDADADLIDYPDGAFDYVILSQTIQAVLSPRAVLGQMLRIGRRAVIALPNFGYWRVRLDLGLFGRMPLTPLLPHEWYDTPNIHLCTITDFMKLTRALDCRLERFIALDASGKRLFWRSPGRGANFFASQGVFVLGRES